MGGEKGKRVSGGNQEKGVIMNGREGDLMGLTGYKGRKEWGGRREGLRSKGSGLGGI